MLCDVYEVPRQHTESAISMSTETQVGANSLARVCSDDYVQLYGKCWLSQCWSCSVQGPVLAYRPTSALLTYLAVSTCLQP